MHCFKYLSYRENYDWRFQLIWGRNIAYVWGSRSHVGLFSVLSSDVCSRKYIFDVRICAFVTLSAFFLSFSFLYKEFEFSAAYGSTNQLVFTLAYKTLCSFLVNLFSYSKFRLLTRCGHRKKYSTLFWYIVTACLYSQASPSAAVRLYTSRKFLKTRCQYNVDLGKF